jgi:hypothetical protein
MGEGVAYRALVQLQRRYARGFSSRRRIRMLATAAVLIHEDGKWNGNLYSRRSAFWARIAA